MNSTPAIDQLYEEISSKFWTIFFFYIVASIGWIMYCCISNKIELEKVEKNIHKNGLVRQLELRRLLDAYNNISISQQQQQQHQGEESNVETV